MKPPRVVIAGGGISGLAAAYFLSKRGVTPLVLEQSSRFGGLIETRHTSYGDLESGPDSFIASKTSVAQLARELGIADRIIDSNDAQRRVFIGRKGRLVPMPRGMVMMAPADLKSALRSPLFSARTKAHFLRETLRSPMQRHEDVTLEKFVIDHFGREMLDNVAEPLLTGVYGGDPAQLSVQSVLPRFLEYERAQGSLIRAVQQEKRRALPGSLFQSFAGGMQTLVDALECALDGRAELRTESEVLDVARTGSGWSLTTTSGNEVADHLVIATPAHSAAHLLQSASPALASLLLQIPYSSAILVTFVFEEARLVGCLQGFGFLVPRKERDVLAAATFIGTKFPQRLKPGYAAVRCFIIGRKASELAYTADATIVAAAAMDLNRWTALGANPILTIVQRWPDSMPQYALGHSARLQRIQECVACSAGLHLCGNAYIGVGIPDCIRMAGAVADGILPM